MSDGVVLAVLALCSAILTGIGTFLLKSFLWATARDGPIERVIDSHLEFVKSSEEMGRKLLVACENQEKLHATHFAECVTTAEGMRTLLSQAEAACDTLELIAREAHMGEEVIRSIERIRSHHESALDR